MVENGALADLRLAMERAIYRAIAAQGAHRLPFKTWSRARDLGVDLPEATPWLRGWTPTTADASSPFLTGAENVETGNMIIIRPANPDIDQAAAPVLQDASLLGGLAVDPKTDLEGYGWYDRLPRVIDIDFICERGGKSWFYGTSHSGATLDDLESGPVDALLLDLTMRASGDDEEEPWVKSFDAAALVMVRDTGWLGETAVLFLKSAPPSPEILTDLIDASFFCASEDADSDSWQTQYDRFRSEAQDLANTLLLGEEEALIASLRAAFADHVRWLIPEGRAVTLTAGRNELDLSLSPPG